MTREHPMIQASKIGDLRTAHRAHNAARRHLDDMERALLDAVHRAQVAGVTWNTLADEVDRGESTLRRQVSEHRSATRTPEPPLPFPRSR